MPSSTAMRLQAGPGAVPDPNPLRISGRPATVIGSRKLRNSSHPTQMPIRRPHVEWVALDMGILRQSDLLHCRGFGRARLDGAVDGGAQLDQHLAKARNLGKAGRWRVY